VAAVSSDSPITTVGDDGLSHTTSWGRWSVQSYHGRQVTLRLDGPLGDDVTGIVFGAAALTVPRQLILLAIQVLAADEVALAMAGHALPAPFPGLPIPATAPPGDSPG
jgi:hypothetical protein